jgi:hypothetical protein
LCALYLVEGLLVARRVPRESSRCPNSGERAGYALTKCLLAAQAGVPFDARTRLEVILDLEAAGTTAWPVVVPRELARRYGDEALARPSPLGGISRARTVYCNEGGAYAVFDADEHGFRNPLGMYKPGAGILLVGDSFVHGSCVKDDETIAATLRQSFRSAIALGADGNGPLTALALIREYGHALRPREVVWLYYEGNDPGNLEDEKTIPLLRRYLEPDFSQRLIERQPEIDAFLRSVLRAERAIAVTKARTAEARARLVPSRPLRSRPWMRFIRMAELRRELTALQDRPKSVPLDIQLLATIVREAHGEVASWGGQFRVAYLPEWRRFARRWSTAPHRAAVLGVLADAGVPVIDLVPVFESYSDSLSLFPFRASNHYAPVGHALVGRTIQEAVRRRPRP